MGEERVQRRAFLAKLARITSRSKRAEPLLVAVDGVDGAGKTRLADELEAYMTPMGFAIIRAGVDSFPKPRALRKKRGSRSPEGFYRDSFNYAALKTALLEPLLPLGSRIIRRAVFDWRSDTPVDAPQERVGDDAILLFDGIFLHRPELIGMWGLSIFLQVDFKFSYARMAARDGCPADPLHPQNHRYVEGQKLYLQECRPADKASVLVDYNNLDNPLILRDVQDPC